MIKTIVSLLAFGAILSADPPTVTFVDPGNPLLWGYNAYVGPYTLNINGQDVPAMCVNDFIEVGGTWSANRTAVTSSDFSNTYLGNGGETILGTQYEQPGLYGGSLPV